MLTRMAEWHGWRMADLSITMVGADLGPRPDREDRLNVRLTVTVHDSLLSSIRRVTRTRVSVMTIHRWLIEQNLLFYRPLRHFALMPAHCRVILQLCLAQSGWNHADQGRIVFSDESHFQLCPDDL
ncbi:hypothetical protein TNCV_2001401 [Trichonephila clavipes]|nr:hypothetical protein TNCV_2001401 [Trichonephila clavipes]